ncbi:hypothetical protein [Candidatus Liberibacter solanacearum]|uniref:hypothetical protein n=1 Tax=Candidatus Liberibacter solanacearum TaxID=556287 RepID=UPI001177AD41|nr:hypothetical protein [Candidatus Liberibacter solanacearum]
MNEKTRKPILEVDQIEKLRAVYHIFRAVENAERAEDIMCDVGGYPTALIESRRDLNAWGLLRLQEVLEYLDGYAKEL